MQHKNRAESIQRLILLFSRLWNNTLLEPSCKSNIIFIVLCMLSMRSCRFEYILYFVRNTMMICHFQILSSAMLVACVTAHIGADWSECFGEFEQWDHIGDGDTRRWHIENFPNTLPKWRGDIERHGTVSSAVTRYVGFFFSRYFFGWLHHRPTYRFEWEQ